MVDVVLGVALLLLVGGVLGSVLPVLPAGPLSLAGVALYAVVGAEPIGALVLGSMLVVGVVATVLEGLAGPIAARASGVSMRTTLVATLCGLALFVLAGPAGIIAGTVGGVALVELHNGADLATAARRATVTAVGLLGAAVFQVLLTTSILLTFLLAVVV